jgi:MarR-like DNA-binding transcriptional regulator SgrR of sgrS sRNA
MKREGKIRERKEESAPHDWTHTHVAVVVESKTFQIKFVLEWPFYLAKRTLCSLSP